MKRFYIMSALAVFSAASAAQATISLSVAGLAGTGVTADVDFTYQSLSDTAATLTVAIENTTSSMVGGFATGFGFNVPTIGGATFTSFGGDIDDAGAQQTTALGAPNESGWWTRFDFEGIKTPNSAGDFDVGVLNQSNANPFITGGVGSGAGVVVGETTTFTLAVVGSGLDDLTNAAFETAFLSALSSGVTPGYSFGVRFQGLANGGSDFAVTTTRTEAVPVPAAAVLALMGISAVGVLNRRRRAA